VAVAASTGSGAATPAETETAPPATASGPLVAYVQNTRSGQVSVLVGETEVVVSDPALVARLASIASGKKA
jgi:L-asparaginase/Glu-tRNA(Gln) amidotransferase subunit D